jgi:tetratricopeptide (TPR) repeat protein
MSIEKGTSDRKPEARMRFSILIVGMAALFMVASAVLVSRADDDDSNACTHANGDEAIAACTRVIQNVGTSAKDRAVAYVNRGAAHRRKGDLDRAIADGNEAIRLDPAYAYDGRGAAYSIKGDFDRGLADFNEAIRVDPKSSGPYYHRGSAYLNKGAYFRAAADYVQGFMVDAGVGPLFR